MKYPSPPLIIEQSDTPDSVFVKQFHRRLAKINPALISIENNSMKVTITKRLTFGETGLPSAWLFGNKTYTVQVDYQSGLINWEDPPDESTRVIKTLHFSNPTSRQQIIGLKHTLLSFVHAYRLELGCLAGISLVFLHEVSPDRYVIVILVTDWEQSKTIEKAVKGLIWSGAPVHVVRDRCMDLIAGEEILSKLLVGSRGGEGGMTIGALLKDHNAGDELLMLQCSHGYAQIGRFQSPDFFNQHTYHPFRRPRICAIGFSTDRRKA